MRAGEIYKIMPKYHNQNSNWYGKIEVIPHSWQRKLFKFWPYYVGDRIFLHVKIEDNKTNPVIFEHFSNMEPKQIGRHFSDSYEMDVIGNVINSTGDVEYMLSGGVNLGITIFTAHAISKDTWLPAVLGMFLTFILSIVGTIIVQVLFGVIRIDPTWILKITK